MSSVQTEKKKESHNPAWLLAQSRPRCSILGMGSAQASGRACCQTNLQQCSSSYSSAGSPLFLGNPRIRGPVVCLSNVSQNS